MPRCTFNIILSKKSELQPSRLVALHVHVPSIGVLQNICSHVDGSDVFRGRSPLEP